MFTDQGFANPRSICFTNSLRDEFADRNDFIKINASLNPQSVKQIQDIFSCHVPRCALGVRTPPKTCDRGVKDRYACLKGCLDIGQGLAIRIVKMSGKHGSGRKFKNSFKRLLHLPSCSNPNSVSNINLITA